MQWNTIQNTISYCKQLPGNLEELNFRIIQCNVMQDNAMQYNAIQCNIMQYNAIQYNTMQKKCNAIQWKKCNAMQCNPMQYNTKYNLNLVSNFQAT